MYTCPGCGVYFKTGSSGKKIKCLKCHSEYLLDLQITDEAWRALDHDARMERIDAAKAGKLAGESTDPSKVEKEKEAVKPEISETKEKTAKTAVPKTKAKEEAAKPAEPETKKEEAAKPAESGSEKEDAAKPAESEVKKEETQKAEAPEVNEAKPESSSKHKIFGMKMPEKPEAMKKAEAREAEGDKAAGNEDDKDRELLLRRNILIVSIVPAVLILVLIITTFVIPRFRINRELPVMHNAQAGDVVSYGKYKGKTEWVVLDRRDDKLLCITKDPVEIDHNRWLNSKYMNETFNIYERRRIIRGKDAVSPEEAEAGQKIGSNDKVFLFSDEELAPYPSGGLDLHDGIAHPVCWIDVSYR